MMLRKDSSQEATEADDGEPFSPEEEEEEEPGSTRKKKKKKSQEAQGRRFSEEQVRSLETIFASETKLEPKKKLQVARQLGLQPRQVAIWFQNKRARWKSKQIEKNYRLLKANYDHLKARFEFIRKEKESLLDQLQELHDLLEKSHEGSNGCKDSVSNSKHISRKSRETITELPVKSSTSLQEEMDQQGVIYPEDDKSGNITYLGHDEPELMNITPIKWCSFDAGSLFDQSNTSSHWWDSLT